MKSIPNLTHASHYALTEIRAIDGDTIQAHVILPLGVMVRRRIRLKHYAAPEHGGSVPWAARAAQARLQAACDGHECMIATHGCREDRYGRLTAVLWIDGAPTTGATVLGDLQLSDAEHRAEVTRARSCSV